MNPVIRSSLCYVILPRFFSTSFTATSIIEASPYKVNSMIGYIRTVEESMSFLARIDAHLFITDFENDDLLYFPSLIYSWIPVAGSRFFPYSKDVWHV